MTTGKVDLTGVESTMLVTLYLRALDSRAERPVLGDRFAADAVARIDYDWATLDKPAITRNRFMLALRARQFDDWTAGFLRRHPDATVLQLACGLDSRVFRLDLPEGIRWFDVDLPDVIALRRRLYDDAEGYRMLATSVTDEGWLDELPSGGPVLVIAEGLLMYLHEPEVARLLRRLTDRFGSGELLFDGVAPWVARTTQLAKKYLGRWYHYPAYWTATRGPADIVRWNPRLRHRDDVAVLAEYDRIPDPALRRFYRFGNRFAWFANYLRVFRAEF
ncbi:class I SAM-dependent methyltransferase [Amycolatopsis suaedae]|uniref:Class I SAM-dependent methyltransferase n=1 Tax=Amycolatopsis suaedae TaxID=2510978 RepID=A0A4Q7JDA1_9PSEU|nr:class I SAM-dependent methyltransferase [Amycolatopsis suaedae]RZQ65870.1 class I SAM-dependent methyltransferase [Amycolatopsis suaedae]